MPIELIIVLLTIGSMEIAAYALHRYVMHGFGWGWHKSHHEPRHGWFEMNDLYALVFAGVSIAFFALSDLWQPAFWIGVGTIIYGLLYTLLHDGIVHRRFGFVHAPRRGYLKRLVQAHRLHHAVHEREGAVSFGFLYAPPVASLRARLRASGIGS